MASRFWVGGSGTWGSTASWSTASGGASGASVPTAADDVFFDAASDGVASTSFTVTLGAAATCLSLSFAGVDQNVTFTGAFTLSVTGNLIMSATKTISVTGITALAMTSTTAKTITSSGGTLTGGITFSAAGPFTLQDAFTTTGTVTHTAGTIAFNGFTLTAAAYSNTGTTARALNFTTSGSKFAINSTVTATVWSIASTTGLTITSPTTGSVDIIGSSNVTRTISTLALAEASSLNFNILVTAGTTTVTASNTFRNLVVNCPGATFSNIAITVYGNLSYLGGTWAAGANLLTLAGTATNLTITGTGGALDFPITYNSSPTGAGAYTLASNVTIGATAARTFSHQQGTLNLSSYTLTVYGTYNTSGLATRTLNFGTGFIDLTLDGSTTTTIWDSTTVNTLTVTNAATGSIRVKGSGTLVRNINTGGLSEANSLSFEFLSTAGTITLTNSNSRIKNLTINCPGTTFNVSIITVYGNLTYTAGTLTLVSGALTFAATSITQTISSAGNLDFPITFSGSGTYSLLSNISIGTTTSRTITLNSGTLELNSYSMTIFGVFSSAGTSTRRIQMSGSGGKIVLSFNAVGTIWDTSTITGLTTDGNVLVQLTGGGAVTKTISAGTLSDANAISFQLSHTAGSVAFTAGNTVDNLTIDNNAVNISNVALTIYGNLVISGTSPTLLAGTNAWTFAGTSDGGGSAVSYRYVRWNVTATKTTANLMQASEFVLRSGGADISMSGTTVTSTVTPATGAESASNLVDNNTGTKYVSSSSTAPWSFTFDLGSAKTFDAYRWATANDVEARDPASWTIEVSSDNTNWTTVSSVTGYIATSTRLTYTEQWSINGSPLTKTITTSGEPLDFPIIFNSTLRTWNLQDALTIGATRLLTLTAGTLNLNGYTCTAAGGFAVTGTNNKVLAHGSGDLVVSLAGSTAFNATGSNLTSTGTGKINMTSASAKTFVGGGNSYATINQGGSGTLTITGSNTFQNITNSVQPATVNFTAGTTSTFTSGFNLSGTSGSLITLGSTTTAAFTISKSSGTVSVSFCTISYSTATGGAIWLSSTTNGNVDGGNNSGWSFAVISNKQYLGMFAFF